MKRFYKLVSTRKDPEGYAILLDGKPVKTPSRETLRVASSALADALAREWMSQKEKIVPASMPLTQLTTTKIDRVSRERAVMQESVLKYFNTDLLCYRTDSPPELAAAQTQSWDPKLNWFAKKFGYELQTTESLVAFMHPSAAHEAVKKYVSALDDDHFTVLQLVTAASGSLILALGFVENAWGAEEVFAAARVEEAHKARIYNEEKYGPDPAQEKKDRALKTDLEAAESYISLL
jgi:chaperone required for assembly of F1-ATPase